MVSTVLLIWTHIYTRKMSARFESACIELTPESSEPLLPAATTKAHFSRSITPTRCRVPALPFLFTTRRPVERKVLSLKRFIKAYSSLFPLCVSIEEGYCNSSLGCELSAGECYTLNFTTTTRSVVVSDGRGKQDTIPMNSHVEYTFLYNPEGNLERAKSGYILPTVRDILDGRRARPDVVCATRSYKGGNEAASVEESEVIVILKQKRRRSGSGILAVYSITFGMVKLLPSQCRGDFTTNPYATKLRITEILGHIEKRFPAKACLFLAPEFDSEVDRNLLDDTVDVLGLQCTNSVAASLSAHGDESLIGLSSHWIEIPSNLPITVSLHCHKNSKSATKDRPLVAETACRRKSETLDHREPHVVVDGPAYNYQPLIEAKDPDIADALYEVAGPSATTRSVSSDICLGVKAIEKSLQVSALYIHTYTHTHIHTYTHTHIHTYTHTHIHTYTHTHIHTYTHTHIHTTYTHTHIHTYTHTHIHTYTHTHIHTYTHTHIHTYTHTHIHTYTHTHIHTYTHTHIHTYTHTHIHTTYTHTHIHTYTHTHIHTYTHTHIHTYTHTHIHTYTHTHIHTYTHTHIHTYTHTHIHTYTHTHIHTYTHTHNIHTYTHTHIHTYTHTHNIHTYTHTHIHTYTHTHIHTYTHTHIHTYTQHTHIHTYTHTHNIHTYTHTHIHTYTHTHIHTYTHTHIHTYTHTHIHIHIHTYTHTHIHTYTHTHIHTYTHTHIHTYTHTHIHTYTHTYIHADVRVIIIARSI